MLDFYYMFKKTKIDFELLHKILKECNLSKLYLNIINALRLVFDTDFDSLIENSDVSFFIKYMEESGIHGYSREDGHQATSHNNKVKYFFHRLFLRPKEYRLSMYPRLGVHWYLFPICLIVHWFYLITHKLKSGIKFIFGKNKNKKIYKQLGI